MSTKTTQPKPDLVSDLLDAGSKEFSRALEQQLHDVRARMLRLRHREHNGTIDSDMFLTLMIGLYQTQATLSLAAAHARSGALTAEYADQIIEATARQALELAIRTVRVSTDAAIRAAKERNEHDCPNTIRYLTNLGEDIEKQLVRLIEQRAGSQVPAEERLIVT